MMVQFDTLISEGVYNILFIGGMGNIARDHPPFYRGQAACAAGLRPRSAAGPLPYSDNDPAPAAGEFVA